MSSDNKSRQQIAADLLREAGMLLFTFGILLAESKAETSTMWTRGVIGTILIVLGFAIEPRRSS